jgi:membrane-associated phospholipid phosphatase
MKAILQYDQYLFKIINNHWQNGFFDWLMPLLRNSILWVPLYFFFILFITTNFKKNGWWWVIFAICTAIITDFVSSSIIKQNIIRLRPCNDPAIASWVKVLVSYKPKSSSFTSSHAANHFGLATYLFVTLKEKFKGWPALFFIWAFFISLAQVYVGVHYPLDITCGALIGILIGYLCAKSFNKSFALV